MTELEGSGEPARMVEGKGSFCLAIDEAIGVLDSIILRLQTPAPPVAETPAVEMPTEAARKEETSSPKLSLDSLKLTAEQQDTGVVSILDRPGKKPLKLPGVSSNSSPKTSGAAKESNEKGSDHIDNFEKAHFQVGLVQSVEDHPVAQKLYVCKVEVAPGQIRQVVAGLRNFIPASELLGQKVALILNLKTAKLAGQLSEAMILAGDSVMDGVENVKVLEPPSSASVGCRIYLEGQAPSASPAKQLSSKIWEKIVSLLKVEGGVATFNKTTLVTSDGPLRVSVLPDGAGIH